MKLAWVLALLFSSAACTSRPVVMPVVNVEEPGPPWVPVPIRQATWDVGERKRYAVGGGQCPSAFTLRLGQHRLVARCGSGAANSDAGPQDLPGAAP
jgi:hypothetical protein